MHNYSFLPFAQPMPEASDKGSQPYSRAVGTVKWLELG